MLLIHCPWCGPRHEREFDNGGPVREHRPDPATTDDDEWRDYLLMRENTAGPLRERWWHVRGCGQWFEVTRDTMSHEIEPDGDE